MEDQVKFEEKEVVLDEEAVTETPARSVEEDKQDVPVETVPEEKKEETPIEKEETITLVAPEVRPIDIEIDETDTVIMILNGVAHTIYEGKKPAPRKIVKKAPRKVAPKPAPKPAPEPEAKPAPVAEGKAEAERPIIYKKVIVKRPPLIQRKNTKPLGPSRKLASFGPGTSDDSLRSIHTASFEEKIKKANKDLKKKYKDLSDYLVENYGCGHRVSFGYDAYRVGRKTVVAISLGGVHLRINAAIDPKTFDGTRVKVNDDSNSRQFKDLPSYIKVISDKTFQQAFRLIDETMKVNGVKKKKTE